jgi:hypothetical protein
VIFAFTIPLFAFDVIMSLEALWFSTLFGWYNFSGLWVSGITVITLITIYLKKAGYFEWFTVDHLHTLGVLVFGFSIFWCYLWFEQFLLQYYSNLPEEVEYFYKRWEPQFNCWFWLNMVINFCAPFFVFMSRDSKRKWSVMTWTCIILVAGHWLDYWQMILPGTVGPEAHWYSEIGIIETTTFAGFVGLFNYALLTALSQFKSLAPKNHPLIQESLHHQVA